MMLKTFRHKIMCSCAALMLFAQDATAGKSSHDDHGEASSAGLPQLDPSTYPSQLFWLLVAFMILYMFYSKRTLPEISDVIENRRDHVQNDLDMAEKIQNEAEDAQKKYETSLIGARTKAAEALNDANKKVADKALKELQSFKEKADKDIAALEKSLKKEKESAMKEMDSIAAAVASEAAQKIVGLSLDIKKAQTVVQSINNREAA